MENICPVCDFNGLYEPPYNKFGHGSDEICPCCGFQFGLDEDGYSDKEAAYDGWRRKWARKGCPWFSNFRLPEKEWNPIVLTLDPVLTDDSQAEAAPAEQS